jgi:hypothetical protein
LLSGIAACPLTASLMERYLRIKLSGRIRIAAVVLIWIAGRIALLVGI